MRGNADNSGKSRRDSSNGADGIVDSTLCKTCQYDLKGLYVEGKCPECGTAVADTVPLCPRCFHSKRIPRALVVGKAGDVDAWECRVCGGAGFDRYQLRAAIQRERENGLFIVRSAEYDLVAQMPAHCGRCKSTMTAIFIDDAVLVDRCDGCGFVWLDAGELPAVAAWMNRHAGDLKTPRDMDLLLGDEEEVRRRSETAEGRREIIRELTTPLAVKIAIVILRLIARV